MWDSPAWVTMKEADFLHTENLRHLFRHRRAFFRMPRGNPGAPGTVTRLMWNRTKTIVKDAESSFNNGRISFHEAVRKVFHAHLALEQFRNEHGVGQPTERRSVLLTAAPILLDEPPVDIVLPDDAYLLPSRGLRR